MSIFKCKMCGGTLEITNNETVAVCEYCGTKQTLPKLDDEKRANLYDRANHFRRSNEYDKAMGIYEQILNEDSTDAEAYWSLVLCRYGIEYVEDPATHKRVPTVNRAQYASIFTDEDYKAALQHADGYQRVVYEEEAQAIDNIQKGILAISQREEPFDVFICYKETDNQGRRTPDSVLANDLYHQLTQEGFRVFFARITMEDKLGSAYEPYIFAALNSAKVMVVLGTKPEHFQAVWVKNEWSRYLSLIKNDAKKMLIPAYKDMDPYDLPEEFSHLQAQDMSKLGFMQDLIRGIKKITALEKPKTTAKETVVVSSAAGNAESLLKRAFMFLEDGDFASANEYCEKVLDLDPENPRGYLGKLMAEQNVRTKEALKDCKESFEEANNYQKVVRFGDAALVAELQGYVKYINDRNELDRKMFAYDTAKSLMERAKSENDFKEAAEKFQIAAGYEDADNLADECLEKAEIARKDAIYDAAQMQMKRNTISDYEKAIEGFQSIVDWKDSEEQKVVCQQALSKLQAEREVRSKTTKKWIKILVPLAIICAVLGIVVKTIIIPESQYKNAISLMEQNQYEKAIKEFEKLNGYKDSRNKISEAEELFLENKYQYAVELYQNKEFEKARKEFELLGDYKNSKVLIKKCLMESGVDYSKIGDSYYFGSYEQDNDRSNGKEKIEWLIIERNDNKALLISKYVLDYRKYNSDAVVVKSLNDYDETTGTMSWEQCDLRSWLNNEFLKNAFTLKERNQIRDDIFILSSNEVEKYFPSSELRVCEPTVYVKKKGVKTNSYGKCDWWLIASESIESSYRLSTSIVSGVGEISKAGVDSQIGVRPAIWLDLAK